MSEILTGVPVARAIRESLTERIESLNAAGRAPCLALIRCGEDPGAIFYEHAATRACEKVGIRLNSVRLPWTTGTGELLRALDGLNRDPAVHGILVLRPLPRLIDTERVFRELRPEKDVDGITVPSLARTFVGRGAGFAPCTAEACLAMLDHYGVRTEGANVVIIGRSLIVGRPLAMLLSARDATVTLCHSKTRELPALCRRADILVSTAGRAALVDECFVHSGQIILDVGVNESFDGKICGDVAFDLVSPLVRGISPVPGGVGTVTTMILARHVVEAAEAQAER